MPQPDLDTLIADVLRQHAAATPLPWSRDVDTIIAAAEIDEFNGGEGYGMATLFRDSGSTRIPVGRAQMNMDYATAAANAAPVLARELKRCREALRKIEQHDGGACGCSTARAALAPEESTHDQ